ncbi:MAG: hypothetical protein DRQ43_05770 [Gammaproteobacteria bacterium]|nr:MAG: hypothetical protein DRQ43_05770 [Gammaproteobacteria bacterium]
MTSGPVANLSCNISNLEWSAVEVLAFTVLTLASTFAKLFKQTADRKENKIPDNSVLFFIL